VASRTQGGAAIDAPAMALSGLCLVHCLALPILSASLPVAGAWAEAEWLHQAFVIAALPFSVIGLMSKHTTMVAKSMIVIGFTLLVLGAFVEALHDYETHLTVMGALLFAAGHGMRWLKTSRSDH